MRRRLTGPLLAGLLCVGIGVGGLGAQRPVLQSGDTVRFQPGGVPHVWTAGRVLEVTDSGMTVLVPSPGGAGEPVRFAWSEVTRLAVARGTETNAYRGGLVGAVIGGGAGALIGVTGGVVLRVDCESNCDPGLEDAFLGGLALGTVGALAGGLAGSLVRTVRWVPADPPSRR